jgi:hypothetical protein
MKRFTCILIAAGAAVSLSLAGAGAASASVSRLDQSANSAATAIRTAAASPADVSEGCGIIASLGNTPLTYSYIETLLYNNGVVRWVPSLVFTSVSEKFCNINIESKGQFEMRRAGDGDSCLAVNTSILSGQGPPYNYVIAPDTSSACDQNGGQGYAWDRWTAKDVGEKDGFTAWEFTNSYTGQCMYYDIQFDSAAIAANCSTSDRFEWFAWNDSNL